MLLDKAREVVAGTLSLDDDDALDRLGMALDVLEDHSRSTADVEMLFRLLERFPNDDAYGAFWQVLHMLEATEGYESQLPKSVHRLPTEFNVRMVNRRLNGSIRTSETLELASLLKSIRTKCTTSSHLHDMIEELCIRHGIR